MVIVSSAKGRRLAIATALLLAALAFGLWRSGLAPRALWWAEPAFSAARSVVFGSSPASLPPLEDPADIAMLERSATETPDPFGTLAQALAALDERGRHLILLMESEEARRLSARAWGMTNETMSGDLMEIEPFLEMLERPFAPPPLEEYVMGEEATARSSALYGMFKALAGESDYSQVHQRMRDAAMRHIQHRWHQRGAAMVLHLLNERTDLDEEAKAALEEAIEHPVFRRGFLETVDRRREMVRSNQTG